MEFSHYSSDVDPSSVLGFGSALALLDAPDDVARLLTGAVRSMELADLQAVVLSLPSMEAEAASVLGSMGTRPLPDAIVDELRRLRPDLSLDANGMGSPSQQQMDVHGDRHPALAEAGVHRLTVVRLGTVDHDFGVAVAGHTDEANPAPVQISTLQMMAAQASMALHRIRLNRQQREKEEALRKSDARYRTLYESAPVAYVSAAPDGEIRMVNEQATDLLGAPKEALIGRSMPHLCMQAPDDAEEEAAQRLQRHLQDGGPLRDDQVQLCRADGETVWVSLTMRSIERPDGAPERLVMMIDITERKRMETALREARDDLEARVEQRTAELEDANDQLRKQTKRLEALREVDRAILAAESPREIATVAVRRAQDIIPCERVSVALFDWEDERVTVLTAQQQDESVLESGTDVPISEFTIPEGLSAGKIDEIPDLDDRPDTTITNQLREAGIRSAITVPMMVEGDLIGAVNLGKTERHAFTDEERRIGRGLAAHLAVAIRQARLLKAVQAQREQLEVRVRERTAELREANAALQDEVEERTRAERALRESQERLSRIIDSAIDAIVSVKPNLEITLFNNAAEEIFQCSAEQADCKSLDQFLTDPFESLVRRHIERHQNAVAAKGEDAPNEGRYLAAPEGLKAYRKDGETFPVEATLCPVHLPDEIQYLLILRDIDELKRTEAELEQLQSEKTYLEEELKHEYNFDEIVGTSAPMQEVFDAIEQVATTETTVLITGETGTGKELVARALHDRSERADQVFVKVNCAALPSDLIESELFGHEKGAFTGATEQRKGRFELADGGTLLLDEIGELPLETQAKLLRVLQHQEFERVGGSQTISVDTRILAATNRDLEADVEAGRFRDDLYYRLNIFPIALPPLRERRDDIPLLARHFCEMYASRTGTEVTGFSANAMAVLEGYDWPGNVRELANIIERAVILTRGNRIRAEHLSISDGDGVNGSSSFETLEDVQRRHIKHALDVTDGVVGGDEGAAQLLDVKRTTLLSRMDRLGIDPSEYRA